MADLVKLSNFSVLTIDRTYLGEKGPKEKVFEAIGSLKNILDLLNRSSVLKEINQQLKKAGLSVRVRIVLWEDDFMKKSGCPDMMTAKGDPSTIHANLTPILKLLEAKDGHKKLAKALAHELIHSKESAYEDAGKEVPYGGHDSEGFKEKLKTFVEKVEKQLDKDSKGTSKDLEDWLKEKKGSKK